jgi:lysophospholipase L1-like esterase
MAVLKVCIMGDSQTAGVENNNDLQSVAHKLRFQWHFDVENLAEGSTNLEFALSEWNALEPARKASFDYVFIAGYNNNLNAITTVAIYIATAQALVDQVRADNATCKIIMSTCVPVYNHWINVVYPGNVPNQVAYHNNWLGVNQALQGLGPTPILRVDGCATEHTSYLNDGADSLKVEYRAGSGADLLHPNGKGEDVIADSWLTFLI